MLTVAATIRRRGESIDCNAVLHAPPYLPFACTLADVTGSEEMSFVQLFIPSEIARTTVSTLGELGSIEFLDVVPLRCIF